MAKNLSLLVVTITLKAHAVNAVHSVQAMPLFVMSVKIFPSRLGAQSM
jgi:hypothetical protein